MENCQPEEISASLEDYLEAIFHLEKVNRVARAKDIAERLQVSRASVTGALRTLSDRELVNYEPYSYITLTDKGRSIAREVVRRHDALMEFFQGTLHMDPEQSEIVACRVEHAIDSITVDRLIKLMAFLEECPRTRENWNHYCREKCNWGQDKSYCAECLEGFDSRLQG